MTNDARTSSGSRTFVTVVMTVLVLVILFFDCSNFVSPFVSSLLRRTRCTVASVEISLHQWRKRSHKH